MALRGRSNQGVSFWNRMRKTKPETTNLRDVLFFEEKVREARDERRRKMGFEADKWNVEDYRNKQFNFEPAIRAYTEYLADPYGPHEPHSRLAVEAMMELTDDELYIAQYEAYTLANIMWFMMDERKDDAK